MRPALVLIALFATPWLSGCSSQQLYHSGQAWQQNACNKIIDMQERNRCMANAGTSHDEYKRQTQAAKDGK